MKKINLIWILVAAVALLLTSCRSAAPAETTPTNNPDLVFTAAAQTAQAMMTEIAAQTPTPAPATATHTLEPPTATLAPTTAVPATATNTLAAGAVTSGDNAEYVSDITIPDGTDFTPGATFTKTWQLKNTGSTTWTTDYKLAYAQGDQMSGPASVAIPSQVAPGATVNVSVDLTAPATAGTYRGYWRMQNANGQLFGTAVYVEIDVTGSAATATITGTPGTAAPTTQVTATTGPTATSAPAAVSGVSMSVDNASVSGACPHTFTFTGQFTLAQPATVTYRLEAGSDSAGFPINLPDPVTNALGAGTHTLVYNLEFTQSINGWARLHITQPIDVTSNQATFNLTCQ